MPTIYAAPKSWIICIAFYIILQMSVCYYGFFNMLYEIPLLIDAIEAYLYLLFIFLVKQGNLNSLLNGTLTSFEYKGIWHLL